MFSVSDRTWPLKITIVVNTITWFYLAAKILIFIHGDTITNLENTPKNVLVGHFFTVKTLA